MKLIALMLTRNEEWVVGCSARAALQWCDDLVVLDHASTDRTLWLLQELQLDFPERVHVIRRPGGEHWPEMEHRQATLDAGRALGGTHFAIVDADEVPASPVIPELFAAVAALEPGQILDVPMVAPWGSLDEYRVDDCVWTRAMLTVAFADTPRLCWHRQGDGYEHHHRPPFGASGREVLSVREGGGVMHLQFADRERLAAKHALYKMVEVARWPGRRSPEELNRIYGQALDETGLRLAGVPGDWWAGLPKASIHLGRRPWQVAACRDLHGKYPPNTFDELELWGVI